MSYAAYSSARRLLINYTPLTAKVAVSNVRVGFAIIPDDYPCISLTQVGGSALKNLGYKTSPDGSRIRRDDRIFQIDIYSRSGVQDLEQIADEVDKALLSGSTFEKLSDNDRYEDSLHANRKIQTWTFFDMLND